MSKMVKIRTRTGRGIGSSRSRIAGVTRLVEREFGDIRVVSQVARDKLQAMLQGRCCDYEVEGTVTHTTAVALEFLTQPSATSRDCWRKGQSRHHRQEALELLLGAFGVETAQRPLVDLHVGDDADRDALGRKALDYGHRRGVVGEIRDDEIRVEQVGHDLGGTADRVLAPLVAQVGQESFGVDVAKRAATLA